MASDTCIEVAQLIKAFTIDGEVFRAVDDVSLVVGSGEIVSIVGHSGSGKTTLLSLMGGLTRPDAGSVRIAGTDIWSLSDDERSGMRNRKLSYIYQFASLVPTLTALENIMLPTSFGSYPIDVEGYARELLGLVGLSGRERAYPAHLSGGQQRRIAIARAFITSPEVVLADEPTGDLDEETEAEIIRLFHRMNTEKAITFVIVTHNREIARHASRRFRMSSGVLAAGD